MLRSNRLALAIELDLIPIFYSQLYSRLSQLELARLRIHRAQKTTYLLKSLGSICDERNALGPRTWAVKAEVEFILSHTRMLFQLQSNQFEKISAPYGKGGMGATLLGFGS